MGFIWCDGYVSKRHRGNHNEYAFKVDLKESDLEHLKKLNINMNSNYPIKIYGNGKGSYNGGNICRLHISVKYFGENLYNNFGLIPNRSEIHKLKNNIPNHLMKHFIRGVLDSDGSFSYYMDNKYNQKKMSLKFSTYENLLIWINEYLYENDICSSILNLSKRHAENDEECMTLNFSGRNQVKEILNYLYGDATIYLDRKFIKYKELLEFDK